MATLIFLLLSVQIVGAVIGTAYAVLGELAYVRSLKDGAVSRAEALHLEHIARGLRYGMALPLIASVGLIVVAYTTGAPAQPALTASYWLFTLLTFVIIQQSWALSRKKVSFELASAAIFTGWWFLLFQTLGQLPISSFGAGVAAFVVVGTIFYILLKQLRILFSRS